MAAKDLTNEQRLVLTNLKLNSDCQTVYKVLYDRYTYLSREKHLNSLSINEGYIQRIAGYNHLSIDSIEDAVKELTQCNLLKPVGKLYGFYGNYVVNEINQAMDLTNTDEPDSETGIDIIELIKYAKDGVKRMNKKLSYDWDLERHVVKWWHDKDMEDIRELMAVDILGDYMRDNLLLDENAEVDTTKAMELMEMICNHYNQSRIYMRIACSDERKK